MRAATTNRQRGMIACLTLGFGLLTLGCQPGSQEPAHRPPPADAGGTTDVDLDRAEREVIAAHEALVKSYEDGDIDAFAGLLAPAPELLIFHPTTENRFDGIEEVRQHMATMFEEFAGAEWTDFHPVVEIDGNVAWVTSQIAISSLSFETPFVGRGTEIWVHRDDRWKLAHAHWSAVPPSRY